METAILSISIYSVVTAEFMIVSYIKLTKKEKCTNLEDNTTNIAPNYIHYWLERTTLFALREYLKNYKKGHYINSIPVFDCFQ